MRATFEPQTVILGATRQMDATGFLPAVDKRGRLVWAMPNPISYEKHKGLVDGVPVYRGTSASYARYVRAQVRRARRKAAERESDD